MVPLAWSVLSRIYCFVRLAHIVLAVLQNTTVDDAVLVGAVVPQYLPSASAWNIGNTCTGCLVKPDPSLAYNGTWHDSTYSPNSSITQAIEFTFTGSALYIFFIIANEVAYATTFTDIEFLLDNEVATGTYVHNPEATTDYQYNVAVYANESMSSSEHNMVIQPVNSGSNVLMLFDYLVYTTDTSIPVSPSASEVSVTTLLTVISPLSSTTSPPSSSTPSGNQGTSSGQDTGAIVGGIVGGVTAVALVAAFLLCYRRYKRRKGSRPVAELPPVPAVEPFVLSRDETPTSFVGTKLSAHRVEPASGPASSKTTGFASTIQQSSIPPSSILPSSVPPSSAPPSSVAASSVDSPPTVAADLNSGLLAQVELLRDEVARLRDLHELPPEYS